MTDEIVTTETAIAVSAQGGLKKTWSKGKKFWDQVKEEFIKGIQDADGVFIWPSIGELAARHHCHRNSIEKRSGPEGWLSARDVWRNEFHFEHHRKRIAKLLYEDEKASATNIHVAAMIKKEIIRTFTVLELAREDAIKSALDQGKTLTAWMLPALKPAEIRVLADAVKSAQHVEKLAMGLPTELSAAQDVAEQKISAAAAKAGFTRDEILLSALTKLRELPAHEMLRQIDALTAPPIAIEEG